MSFFRRPDYRSDTTNFINDLKQQKPELDKQQQAGRVEQQPYVYQTNHS